MSNFSYYECNYKCNSVRDVKNGFKPNIFKENIFPRYLLILPSIFLSNRIICYESGLTNFLMRFIKSIVDVVRKVFTARRAIVVVRRFSRSALSHTLINNPRTFVDPC